MTSQYTIRDENEVKTLELLDTFEAPDTIWSTSQCVKMAIRATWSQANTADRIGNIAGALGGIREINMETVQKTLSAMVRAKILRTRKSQGKYLYEVNF